MANNYQFPKNQFNSLPPPPVNQFDPYMFNHFQHPQTSWSNGGAFNFIPDTLRNSPSPSCSSSDLSIESQGDESAKKPRWSQEQTATLIREWKDRMEKVESPQSSEAWKEIVAEVNRVGSVKRTLKQCKDKLKNLKQAYKEAKAKNKETGESPQTSPFYDELDEVLGTRAVITMPGVKQVGQNLHNQIPFTPESPASIASDEDLDNGSDDSGGKTERKGKASARKGKRKADGDDDDDDEPIAKQKKRRARAKSSNFADITEQFIEAQNKQMEMLEKCQERTENLLLKLEMDQRKADEENRRRDREFLMKMAELLAKK